jgi:hypothetical protein
MIFFRKTFPILLLVFLLSVIVRLPQLGRPLSKHHEFCTAVSLRILQIWYDNGIEKYNYNPVMTYNNPADKFINNEANASGGMHDADGNYYYVSHPPFAYYFPYFIFKVLHVRPDVLPLQILNMLLGFLTAVFVYFTVCLLSFNRARSYLHFPSFIAYSVYLFMPATLWFQGNVYMSDMFVHLPFVIGVYIVLKMILRRKFYVPKYIFFYVLILFIMIYTSWLGVFYAFGVLVYSLLHARDIRGFRVLMLSTIVVTFFTLRLITYQYSQINGLEAYIHEVVNRYLLRGSVGEMHHGFMHFLFSYFILFKDLIYNYLVNYLAIYLLIAGFARIAITKAKLKIVFSENGYRFIWLSVLPVVLMHLVFMHYSSQDFTVLYASLFFSVLIGILYDKMKKSGVFSDRAHNGFVLLTIVAMLGQFYLTNLPGSHSLKGVDYDLDKKMGEIIKKECPKDAVAVMFEKPSPQLVFYAGRNILFVKSVEEAYLFRHKRRQDTKGAVDDQRVFNFEHSNKSSDLKVRLTILAIEDTVLIDKEVKDSVSTKDK